MHDELRKQTPLEQRDFRWFFFGSLRFFSRNLAVGTVWPWRPLREGAGGSGWDWCHQEIPELLESDLATLQEGINLSWRPGYGFMMVETDFLCYCLWFNLIRWLMIQWENRMAPWLQGQTFKYGHPLWSLIHSSKKIKKDGDVSRSTLKTSSEVWSKPKCVWFYQGVLTNPSILTF